ncbi:hypothetical protein ABENE_09585 [Asticcacaulis benevestitus DSM 16100 = ATCC BAA-896]|uniref:Uncharacterized protein n=1 Tax=Asticcacaulis benevestitus DSM 16100 = ATCC BAA-896 TaxID=1121022 RepID=V4Q208_9CAUL|nr:hypothetical protein ABENE_09585 [Asticcacaulis benevestitus DSM 16100 = ATCC BAA-896]
MISSVGSRDRAAPAQKGDLVVIRLSFEAANNGYDFFDVPM